MKITLQILLSREFGWWRSRGTRLNIASDNTSLVTGDPSFMLVSDNIPHNHCSRCLVSPFKKGRDLWNNEYVFTWLSWKTIGEHIKETNLPTLFIALLTCKLV